jgi:glutamate/aspartate transport system permease protein
LQLSFLLAALAIAGGIFFGSILAVLRMSSLRPVAWAALAYVNFFRSVPLILVIFWIYFLVPLLLGRATGPFLSAVIAFTLFETAYYCEIIRAGIQSIPRGQILAGRAAGMTRVQAMRHIVIPQAFRNMTPILLTQSIILFQDTSLVYVVTLRDFMTSASTVANQELRLVELYVFAALVYLAICFTGSRIVARYGRDFKR